ncbi:MAG TPA: hypothetical protein VFA41_22490 [Ktedonobacteraceae bacterium]|jgi:hypothetical protein|nr:hypothetical protein [Ktedonobacteraceae bacterium]
MAEKKTSKASAGKPEPTHQPGTSKGEEKAKEAGKEPGRRKTGTTGAKRPAGKSTGRDSTGLNPSEPIDKESPNMPTP